MKYYKQEVPDFNKTGEKNRREEKLFSDGEIFKYQ